MSGTGRTGSGWWSWRRAGSIAEGVALLLQKLRREVQWPRGQTPQSTRSSGRRAGTGTEDKALGETAPEWNPDEGGERVLVAFSSSPPARW